MIKKVIIYLFNIFIGITLAIVGAFTMMVNTLFGYSILALGAISIILTAVFYNKKMTDAKYKKYLLFSRISSIILAATLFFVPVIQLLSAENQSYYGLKRAVYSFGSANIKDNRAEALPKTLPDNCENYYFMLDDLLHTREYGLSAIVKFSTDKDTIAAYEAEFAEKGYIITNSAETFEDYLRNEEFNFSDPDERQAAFSSYLGKYGTFCCMSHSYDFKKINITDFSKNFIVYDFNEKLGFYASCVIDKDNGIVMFCA